MDGGAQSSVLFDGQNQYYGQQPESLQFFSFSGPQDASYGADMAAGPAPTFDGQVDWRAAFGTGGFANEPPLLEGWPDESRPCLPRAYSGPVSKNSESISDTSLPSLLPF